LAPPACRVSGYRTRRPGALADPLTTIALPLLDNGRAIERYHVNVCTSTTWQIQ
jgi:hypothetical protein